MNAREEIIVVYIGADRGDDPERPSLLPRARLCRQSPAKPCAFCSQALRDAGLGLEKAAATGDRDGRNAPKRAWARRISRTMAAPFSMWSPLPGRAETLAGLAGVSPWDDRRSGGRRGDVMLGEIAFDHPLFASWPGLSSTISPRSASGNIGVSMPIGWASRACWRGSRTATPPSSRNSSAKDGSSCWRAAGSRPTASSPGRRNSCRSCRHYWNRETRGQ